MIRRRPIARLPTCTST